MNNIFTVKGLDLFYGNFKALKNICIDIPQNQITALIGPSGCGKSTFLKTLNRMNDLEDNVKITGDIHLRRCAKLLNGEELSFKQLSKLTEADIQKLDNKIVYDDIFADMDAITLRKRVGMVFQQPNPFPKSIYENVVYGLRINGVKKKADLDEALERSLRQAAMWDEVKDRLHKSALGMSGGQQQRLCIARTLAVNPEVILMDEPTSALDPISTGKIEELCMELKSKYSVVIVTHNMQQATRISDKTAFFLLGEMVEYDKTSKIFADPSDKRTENYITGRFG